MTPVWRALRAVGAGFFPMDRTCTAGGWCNSSAGSPAGSVALVCVMSSSPATGKGDSGAIPGLSEVVGCREIAYCAAKRSPCQMASSRPVNPYGIERFVVLPPSVSSALGVAHSGWSRLGWRCSGPIQ